MDLNELRTNFHIRMNDWWTHLVTSKQPSFTSHVESWDIQFDTEKLEVVYKGEVISYVKEESTFLKDSIRHSYDFPLDFLKQSVTQQLDPCYTK